MTKTAMSQHQLAQLAARFSEAVARQDWTHALEAADSLVAALPGHAGVVYNKALVLKELGRGPERIATLREALKTAPDHANARFELASALMDAGDLAEAAKLFEAYLSEVPDDTDARLNLGQCLLRLDRPGDAVEPLRAAHAGAPGLTTAAALASALRDTGDLAAAKALLADLPSTPEAAALRLKILTQGARGRIALSAVRL